jgi:hypothetical protein
MESTAVLFLSIIGCGPDMQHLIRMNWSLNSRMSAVVAILIGIGTYGCVREAAISLWAAAPFLCFAVLVRRLQHIPYALLLFMIAVAETAIIVQAIYFPRSSTDPIAVIFVPAFAFLLLNLPPLIHRAVQVIRVHCQ